MKSFEMGPGESEKQIQPQDVRTKEDLIEIAPDCRPSLLSKLIDERDIDLTDEERKKIMLESIYSGRNAGTKIYPNERIIEDIRDSGVNFSEEEKTKLLDR